MRVLVGAPVFAVPDLTRSFLNSLVKTPATVMVVDNTAPEDVKQVIRSYGDRVITVVMPENTYCNGGWNQIMQYGLANNYDLIGLGSSDVEMHSGWYDMVVNRAQEYEGEIILPVVGEPVLNPDYHKAEVVTGGVAGFFTFFKKLAVAQVYPIPHSIKHWFGDEYMFNKLRARGWKTTILPDLRAYHQWSAITAQNPEAYKVIERDKKAWQALGGSAEFSNKTHEEMLIENGFVKPTFGGNPPRWRVE